MYGKIIGVRESDGGEDERECEKDREAKEKFVEYQNLKNQM